MSLERDGFSKPILRKVEPSFNLDLKALYRLEINGIVHGVQFAILKVLTLFIDQ